MNDVSKQSRFVLCLAEELDAHVQRREEFRCANNRDPVTGYDLELFGGTSKYQMLADIARLRRELLQLKKLVERKVG